jgi:hypothetical protein
VRLQHLDGGGQQGRALAVGERAQRGAAGVAGEGEAGAQVEPRRVDAHQLVAQHGIEQRRAGALAGDPAAAEMIEQQFGHGAGLVNSMAP